MPLVVSHPFVLSLNSKKPQFAQPRLLHLCFCPFVMAPPGQRHLTITGGRLWTQLSPSLLLQVGLTSLSFPISLYLSRQTLVLSGGDLGERRRHRFSSHLMDSGECTGGGGDLGERPGHRCSSHPMDSGECTGGGGDKGSTRACHIPSGYSLPLSLAVSLPWIWSSRLSPSFPFSLLWIWWSELFYTRST